MYVSDTAVYAKVGLEYLSAALARLDLNRFKKKSGQPLITQGIVYDQFIPFPPAEERNAITNHLAAAQAKIAAEGQRKVALEELFRSTLDQLMTGQIRLNAEPQRRGDAEG
jgi:restriction endonuclease S subunit